MRHKTPISGPFAGRLCRVGADGSLEPAPDLPSAGVGPSVLLPPESAPPRSGTELPGENAYADTRGNRARMLRSLEETMPGLRDPQGRVDEVIRRWDRGVADGSIPDPRR